MRNMHFKEARLVDDSSEFREALLPLLAQGLSRSVHWVPVLTLIAFVLAVGGVVFFATLRLNGALNPPVRHGDVQTAANLTGELVEP
jgi:hypothetical protein